MDDDHTFEAFLLGMFLGAIILVLILTLFGGADVSDYPGLSERLTEERNRCEARPDVISCQWSESEATFVPRGED